MGLSVAIHYTLLGHHDPPLFEEHNSLRVVSELLHEHLRHAESDFEKVHSWRVPFQNNDVEVEAERCDVGAD